MTPRKPRPDLVDRAAVEAMIAEAVAAERKVVRVCTALVIRTSPMTWPTVGSRAMHLHA